MSFTLHSTIVLSLVLILSPVTLFSVNAASTDPACQSACSDWSVVLGYCRAQYPDHYVQQNNQTYMNDFLSCCCQGSENTTVLGNSTIIDSAETCQACVSTPSIIKNDLSQFVNLCAVQAQNGTASEAIHFRPEAYTTSGDGTTVESSDAKRRLTLSSLLFNGGTTISLVLILGMAMGNLL